MGSPFTGLTAKVEIGNETLAYISGVDLNLEKDIIEILAFGMEYKEKVPAIRDWSASIDGTVALATGSTQKTLYDAFNGADKLTIGIYLDDTTYFSGDAYVQSFNIDAAPDDKINLSSTLEGTGAVTLTIPE